LTVSFEAEPYHHAALSQQVSASAAAYVKCGSTEDEGITCFAKARDDALQPWPIGSITSELIQKVRLQRDALRLTFYQIVNGNLYRNNSGYDGLADSWKGCFIQPRCKGIEHFLVSVLQNARRAEQQLGATPFPNVEFFVNVRDNPAARKKSRYGAAEKPLPIFSFSVPNNAQYADIMYPSWAFHGGGPWLKELSSHENRRIWNWDVVSQDILKEERKIPWKSRKDVLFFRGSRTTNTRDVLIDLGQKNNSLIDIQYTKGTSQRADAKRKTPAYPQVHLREHCHYRYLVNIRGVAASFRFRYVLLCGSLVFHVQTQPDYLEFFYGELRPWVHYIPLAPDLSDVHEKLDWARKNQHQAEQIARAGQDFILSNLKISHVTNYWDSLLRTYATRQDFEPETYPDMTLLFESHAHEL
jgi:protein glucosyltransferase